jgi:hypothetical protein
MSVIISVEHFLNRQPSSARVSCLPRKQISIKSLRSCSIVLLSVAYSGAHSTILNMATTTTTTTESEVDFPPIKLESVPPAQTFTADADPKDVTNALEISGGCRIKNTISKDILTQVERELRPHIRRM